MPPLDGCDSAHERDDLRASDGRGSMHAYRYSGPSQLLTAASGTNCRLVSDGEALFRGVVAQPRHVALGLRALSNCVRARFYTPPGVLEPLLDPVVTVGQQQLRFEGFSGCCSTYARFDLAEDAFTDIEARTRGTTNVDFQAPMRAALAQVRDDSPMTLAVGRDSVAVEVGGGTIVERKVPFPLRWLRGLGEVQAYLSRMEPRFEISRAEALRFVRALPSRSRHVSYAVPLGRGLRLTQTKSTAGVAFTGTERLRLLEDLLPKAESLAGYAEPCGGSAWVLRMGAERFTLVLSPERWRGFSGEGQLLGALAMDQVDEALARVQASLHWQDRLDLEELSRESGLGREALADALALLAARGHVGFDLQDGAWFHRSLPFDLEQVKRLHPRLQNARKLAEAGAVQLEAATEGLRARVQSGDVSYQVSVTGIDSTCSCPWFSKHHGERGPCKHILATRIVAEERST